VLSMTSPAAMRDIGLRQTYDARREPQTWGEVSLMRVRIAVRGLGEAFASEVVFPDPLAVVGGMIDGPADAGVLVPDAFMICPELSGQRICG
jgi:hypothetical protein